MATHIKMVWTGPDNCIFIYGLTPGDTPSVVFRSGRNIKHLQVELAYVQDNSYFFGPYNVPMQWLEDVPIVEVKMQ